MTEPSKAPVHAVSSDAKRDPRRVVFVTRRTSAAVRTQDEPRSMTYPETFLRLLTVIEAFVVGLVVIALSFDAPLEGIADPIHTPNPAKAPWYFLGLQELLHYFPPLVAGVVIPGLVVTALVVIPYFDVNMESGSIWSKNKPRKIRIAAAVVLALCVLFAVFDVFVALVPTLLIAAFLFISSNWYGKDLKGFRGWLASKPLPFWIMTWFLVELIVLTAVGTFFRGPGWSWVLPWRS